ncbi:MAG: hypothetical protein Q8L00_02925, partial [Deltaproteobacteria bacterium]|nr:hypothetical protein [Deltaproteobacteria bacterium]
LTWFWTSGISAKGSMTVGALRVDMAHSPDLGDWVMVLILPGCGWGWHQGRQAGLAQAPLS